MFLKFLLAKLKDKSGQAGPASAVVNEPAAKGASGQAQGNAKLEGLLADIDLSDVPEEHREVIKNKLAEKVKFYDAGFRSKSEMLANDKKELESQKRQVENLVQLRDEIQGNPTLEKEITRVINQARAGSLNLSQSSTDKQIKKIDKLLESAPDADTRETLRQLKDIIEESIPGEDSINKIVEKALAPYKDVISNIQKSNQIGQAERVDSVLDKMSDSFGKELVTKHREKIKETALKLNSSERDIKRLLYHFAEDDEIEDAVLNRAKQKKEMEEKRKMEGTSIGSFRSSAPIETKKDKHGRTDIGDLMKRILS